MKVQDVQQYHLQQSILLSRMQVKNMISPLEVITILNENRINFVLVGAHGISGWMRKSRATQDVDLVIADKHLKKATRLLTTVYPHLEPVDLEVVIRLRVRDSDEVLIDLMKQRGLYRLAFQHTLEQTDETQTFRVPTLEMALAMKFAAMISPNRQRVNKFQDLHDFGRIVESNPDFDREELRALGEVVYPGGGAEILEIIRRLGTGEKLEL